MVDGSAPGQVTDMLVVFETPAWVLEIAGKTHVLLQLVQTNTRIFLGIPHPGSRCTFVF